MAAMPERPPVIRMTILLPPEMHATLSEIAKRERRSIHQQILYYLERSTAQEPGPEKQPGR